MQQQELDAQRLADELGGALRGPNVAVSGIATLGSARTGSLAFVVDPAAAGDAVARALEVGAVVLHPADVDPGAEPSGTVVLVANPRAAFASAVAGHFAPRVEAGVAATARVHATAAVDPSAHIGEYSVVGPGAVIGAGAEIREHVVISRNVRVGDDCLIKSHAVVGEEGFGIDVDADGNNIRIPHLGSVVLGKGVEVGNFTTVCSGTIDPTTVGDHTKIDDHVHISHNCRIGSNAIITACAEISGSVTVGDGVWIGPNASIIQGVEIGARALVGIGAVVTKSIAANEVQFGNPSRRVRDRD